ncbi:toll/interleukin-1 receptor domain-containing protein [Pinibacter aurantiacus]|uniref:Toll/interleukin-1 receptor domain-containing protein n=1 Tax=Pinibacter aurantiacus TaxID=2851599 RepID=A0A9E2W6P1_9BACT|nr:toll/interleukin-1 receptor domain-containing protein [Pinibacter aurantiacus]MBV4360259.1 toll/interleukin-1 receptor domain-containing protein [Pinibacter aurantiacus]
MKVFISWSGQRSKETAEVLSSWIRQVIQSAETWISTDIEKGTRWNDKVNKELEQTKVGIICLNKENLSSEWLLFEAGALSKTTDAFVCTFLLDVTSADIKPPLGQFQHTSFLKDDVKKLMHSINSKILISGEKNLPEKDLDEVFEIFWPRLESKLEIIQKKLPSNSKSQRTDRDILEEILQAVRSTNTADDLTKNFIYYYLLDNNKRGAANISHINHILPKYFNSSYVRNLEYDILLNLLESDKENREKDTNPKDEADKKTESSDTDDNDNFIQ